MLPLKTLPWNPLGEFWFSALAIHFSCFVLCNKCCTFLHRNLVPVEQLDCGSGKQTQAWFGSISCLQVAYVFLKLLIFSLLISLLLQGISVRTQKDRAHIIFFSPIPPKNPRIQWSYQQIQVRSHFTQVNQSSCSKYPHSSMGQYPDFLPQRRPLKINIKGNVLLCLGCCCYCVLPG